MYQRAPRSLLLRSAVKSSLAPARTVGGRRFASTSPVNTRRSWKNSALRWGIAVAGIYYYNTSPVFAEQPSNNLLNPHLEAIDEAHDHSVLEALASRKSRQPESGATALHSAADALSSENASTTVIASDPQEELAGDDPAALEAEAQQEGAFNPETGEINWDCPCLGGMAHGPCGPEFREAFSCFVFSTEEPKGMDCIEKFQGMQTCFQKYPEVYKGELEDDEELDEGLEEERQKLAEEIAERRAAQKGAQEPGHRLLEEPAPKPAKSYKKRTPEEKGTEAAPKEKQETSQKQPLDKSTTGTSKKSAIAEAAEVSEAQPETEPVPRAAHDASDEKPKE